MEEIRILLHFRLWWLYSGGTQMQNNDLAAILESKITGNTIRIGRKLAEEIVKALKGERK